jgi:hypothetical protein
METENKKPETAAKMHEGSCHCGRVRFRALVDATSGGKCNCSICTKLGAFGTFTKPEGFTLLEGEDALSSYEWGGKISRRYFCKHCGVHCFGRGHLKELGGDYVSVSLLTIDDADPNEAKVVHWDGRHDNWRAGPRPTPWPIVARR